MILVYKKKCQNIR